MGAAAWSAPASPPPPPPRTKRTRRVPHPVLIGHAASLTPPRTNRTRRVPLAGQRLHDASTTAGERRKLPALLIMYTAQRDAVAELMRCKVREPEEFEWQRQQRFAWREHDKAALAETAGHALPYGFEFVGARRRLVPNAGTVRSFVFAVQAMAAWSCAVLAGPPGCGKTETMKELARLLGRFSLDLTCSSEITYATVTSMLAGLCHSGAWGCFDRIGCLPEGVLSVVAQQLSAVLAAQRGGAWRGAWTDGKAFTLQPTTAFFVPPPPLVLSGHAASLTPY